MTQDDRLFSLDRIMGLTVLGVVQADFDIELQRNKYCGDKKEQILAILADRGARAAALFSTAKGEGRALCTMLDSLQATAEDLASINSAAQLR